MHPDIDIDLADRTQLLKLIPHVAARLATDPPRPHATGVYVTDIPRDPVLGCAAIDYDVAESRGYFKIDLLNQGVYQLVKDEAHLQAMMQRTPPWTRLWQEPQWSSQLVHIGNYIDLLQQMQPDGLERMAAFISIIRPGKAHLRGLPWSDVFDSVWDGDDSRGFVFKKAHAVSYAHLVVLHMNLLDSAH